MSSRTPSFPTTYILHTPPTHEYYQDEIDLRTGKILPAHTVVGELPERSKGRYCDFSTNLGWDDLEDLVSHVANRRRTGGNVQHGYPPIGGWLRYRTELGFCKYCISFSFAYCSRYTIYDISNLVFTFTVRAWQLIRVEQGVEPPRLTHMRWPGRSPRL